MESALTQSWSVNNGSFDFNLIVINKIYNFNEHFSVSLFIVFEY